MTVMLLGLQEAFWKGRTHTKTWGEREFLSTRVHSLTTTYGYLSDEELYHSGIYVHELLQAKKRLNRTHTSALNVASLAFVTNTHKLHRLRRALAVLGEQRNLRLPADIAGITVALHSNAFADEIEGLHRRARRTINEVRGRCTTFAGAVEESDYQRIAEDQVLLQRLGDELKERSQWFEAIATTLERCLPMQRRMILRASSLGSVLRLMRSRLRYRSR
jgi:hypothetical protein